MKSFTIATLFLAIGSATAQVCGSSGYDNSGHDSASLPAYTVDTTANTPQLCSTLCKSNSTCQSFAIGKETCLLYSAPTTNNFTPYKSNASPTRSPYYFYDASCEVTSLSPPVPHSSPICGLRGNDRGNPPAGQRGSVYTVDTLKRAAEDCRAQPGCTAFAIISNLVTHRGTGVYYYTSLVDNFDANPGYAGEVFNFYELSCLEVSGA
jgi:hypothetical protein